MLFSLLALAKKGCDSTSSKENNTEKSAGRTSLDSWFPMGSSPVPKFPILTIFITTIASFLLPLSVVAHCMP